MWRALGWSLRRMSRFAARSSVCERGCSKEYEKVSIFPTRILVAVDDSADSTLALRAAVDLACSNDSELHVMHVGVHSPWAAPDALHPEEEAVGFEQKADQVLYEQIEKVEGARETMVERHLEMGTKVDEHVVGLADSLKAGLIVVGSRGKNTVERLLLGSEAESILRHAHCPVLVVRR